jgi:phage gp36-like protein
MPFLTADDYKAQVKDSILDTITESTAALLTDAENKAIAQIKSRLNGRFDMNTEMAKAGDARNSEIVMYMVDMVLYHLHSRINPGQVPELRSQRYADAMEWLKAVAAGDFMPALAERGDEDEDGVDDGSPVQWGGSSPRDPYF